MTKREHELLCFIRTSIAANGFAPSFDEMAEGLGLKSKSNSHRLLMSLVEQGLIERKPNRARRITVLDAPK